MGVGVNSVGIIAVICRKCGFRLYWYAIGDSSNRSKFSGPPTPAKALSGYDGGHCPICGNKLSKKPSKLIFMTQKEFNEKYVVGEYKIHLRKLTPTDITIPTMEISNVGGQTEIQTIET